MKHVPKLVLAVLTAVMPVKSIVRLMPRAVTWPGHRPRRAVAGSGPGRRGDRRSVPGRGLCVGCARPPGTARNGRGR